MQGKGVRYKLFGKLTVGVRDRGLADRGIKQNEVKP